VPGKHRFLAGQIDFGICEARARKDVGSAGFYVFARNVSGRLSRPNAPGQGDQGHREKQ